MNSTRLHFKLASLAPLVPFALVLFAATAANAKGGECAKDVDCKGDLICQAGRCVAPGAAPPAAASPTTPAPVVPPPGPPVRPADKAACLASASKGQNLRDAHKVVEAREQFRLCSRPLCPGMVQQDCGTWLGEVEQSVPTVVISARDGAGADLVDVQVSVDGAPLLAKLDGQAIATNPGKHLFHFTLPDGTQLDQDVLIKEGEKNRPVAVTLGKPIAASPPPPPAPPEPAEQPVVSEPVKPTAEAPAGNGASTWKTTGWVVGGVGVLGLGVGTVAGIVAVGDKSGAHCVDNVCNPGTLSGLKTAAAISDAGLIAGGVLLATGAALVVFGPSSSGSQTGATMKVAPTFTASGGGLMLGGRW